MIELRFHKEIYRGEAVDAAIKVYERFASFERAEDNDSWVVRISAQRAEREKRIAAELGNYALGLTIRDRRAG